jgi:membrane-associated phospholipid phosphatase
MRFTALFTASLACAASQGIFIPSAHADFVESSGTIMAIALPITAGAITVFKHDWHGTEELVVDTGLTVGTAYGLKKIIHEERPDKSDMESFPSDTAALAFAPASFLWDRYGWQIGLPAYLAATYVGYSRIEADKHHWWDVAASAGIAFTYSKIFTSEFRGRGFYSSAYATPDNAFIQAGYRW